MKTSYTLGIIGLLIGILIFSAPPSFTNQDGAPVARTNAPGERTCNTSGCHAGNDLNSGSGNLTVALRQNGNTVSQYSPGETYTVRLTLTDQDMRVAGFQITSLDSSNDRAGAFQAGQKTELKIGQNRQYLTHSSTFTALNTDTQTWKLTWEAPTSDKGAVTFYAAGNAANGNSSPTGDFIYASSNTVAVDKATGLANHSETTDWQVYPNPASKHINVALPKGIGDDAGLRLTGLNGRVFKTWAGAAQNGAQPMQLTLPNSLKPGIYILQLNGKQQSLSKSILVQ